MASVWAIGDVHGEAGMLETLLAALPRTADDTTIFLGDLIDRGPDSAAVVRRALAESDASPDTTILLWGNHEDMAASHFGVEAPSHFAYDPYDWFRNGGLAALESYGLTKPNLFVAPCPEELASLFPRLRPYWRSDLPGLEPYIFVHAGLLPGEPPEAATGETLLWIREGFLDYEDTSGRIVVHGHTPAKEVRAGRDKIGIDTGAVFGGLLTALQLPERRVYQANRNGRVIHFDLSR